jgi:diaminohydroxyphosphoribosylaminopyrimidine deaminase / 5-amino-6-(5-phosphoribosylamino)uracil reductase
MIGMSHDEMYMRRAIELAQKGLGSVSPNPMVGCVIVHGDTVIGEGYHQQYGGPHAEPNAVAAVKNQDLLTESTVYVTLEPCAHWGKTPPCANLLVEKKVKKVIIGALDTNPLVAGKGIEILRAAGIEVVSGILEQEVRFQNRRFFCFMEKKRPYIILKWAQTADGFIARKNFDSKWISNSLSRQLVHRWRAEEDGIMVATNTARYDDPQLNVRDWAGRNPTRIVLDKHRALDQKLNLFDQSQATICYTGDYSEKRENLEFVALGEKFDLGAILKDLYGRRIQSLIVEGGAKLLQSFIDQNLWDEARVFRSDTLFGEGIEAPQFSGQILEKNQMTGNEVTIFKNW